ncbi:MAG: YceI family protein [Bacteroidales bacterium]|nr:YceI family protein [Bacteroidales bacterium]
MIKNIIPLLFLLFPLLGNSQGVLFYTNSGKVNFTSDAPLEVIKASSNSVAGAVKSSDRSFAFSVLVKSFEGFNSSLQRTHFNENYLESDKYPKITFEGKIIEDINLGKDGTYNIRGKGKFSVHGVTQERIIPCKIIVSNGKLSISANFTVFLDDHNIKIPAIVNQKIAEEILVSINIEMIIKK